jgi:hypothetical protein
VNDSLGITFSISKEFREPIEFGVGQRLVLGEGHH